MASHYTHIEIPGLVGPTNTESSVIVDESSKPTHENALRVALLTVKLSRRLGISASAKLPEQALPYSAEHDNLVFSAPLTSLIAGQEMRYLRGWKQYDSCVKGFNALGLLGEHVAKSLDSFERMSSSELEKLKVDFLSSRKKKDGTKAGAPSAAALRSLELFDLAIWAAFAKRPVVCSTSSNMGISLHQALRAFQNTNLSPLGEGFTILNSDEGWLVIWCPDEQADFMNSEKTEILRRIEAEQPALTALHTYINRKQRDPGALRDALVDGGYFFPTNPQSKEELQNLLFMSLNDVAKERGLAFEEIISDPKVQQTLTSLDCEVRGRRVIVKAGVEGGLHGLMVPYLIMLEESILRGDADTVSTWNQASIGAALAAAVLADIILRDYTSVSAELRKQYSDLFPATHSYLLKEKLGKNIPSSVHGVFDIANLQSLAQLLGVVVERHLSGRGTALVGLGSSSYANGNRCFEILQESINSDGCFKGKSTFHPMTHTLIPVAQAIVYAEDMFRALNNPELDKADPAKLVMKTAYKPEPAGAAALAGYLLARLDSQTLSLLEIAYVLRMAGFNRDRFLRLSGLTSETANIYIQEAYEEGPYMGKFAQALLSVLDWDLVSLEAKAEVESRISRLKFRLYPLDPEWPESRKNVVNIYLTGDNTRQPQRPLVEELATDCLANFERISEKTKSENAFYHYTNGRIDGISLTRAILGPPSRALGKLEKGLNDLMSTTIKNLVQRSAEKEFRH